MNDTDWKGRAIATARSVGGVFACGNPWDGVVHGDVAPWPPPELIQKLYQSRQSRAYRDAELAAATKNHGYYSDLQSVHSEDAVTWSLFGPIAHASASVREAFTAELFTHVLGEQASLSPAHVWLWRRLPHPDNLVPGGPEIDFGVQTTNVLLLGEAKWRSGIGAFQGVDGTKDQLTLRVQFCEKYGALLYPTVKQFVVLLVAQERGGLSPVQIALGTDRVRVVEATWEELGALTANPWHEEFTSQLQWRKARSHAT